MPNRYWVGGAGTWNATNTANWSATSGGAGGESAPTTDDDVFFDSNSNGASAFTVSIATGAAAKSIDCTGFTRTLGGTGNSTVAGSVTLVAGMGYTNSGTMTFTGTGTLTTAGKTFSGVVINGDGITLTLGDALNVGTFRNVSISRGTFDTANYNVTGAVFQSIGTNTRSITLGSSTVTVSAAAATRAINFTSTGLTFNAGTSQINLTSPLALLSSDSQTFHNVSFTAVGANTRQITGANTFNNLTLNVNATGLIQLALSDNQTVNGTFTCAGVSAIGRGFVRAGGSDTGETRTITAAAVSANDCDFRDITIAGAAAPISPTRAGDCGGNSGITFPAAKTVYRVGTETTWAGSSSWATTSGGTGSDDNFPLAQDTAVIDNNTALSGTLGLALFNIGTLDASTRTTGITLNHNAAANRYGSYTLGSGVTVSGTTNQTFSGRGTMVFASAGKTITFPITVDAPGGTFQLGDAFSSSNRIEHTRGTFDANNYNLTCTEFSSNNSNVRTLTMGSGLWTLTGTGAAFGAVWTTNTITNLTFNKNTADILLSNTTATARVFAAGTLSYNKLTIGGATGSSTTSLGSGSFTELASTKEVAHTVRFAGAAGGTIDTWSITGSAGNVVTVDSSVAGTRRTFNLTNVTSGIDYLNVKDIGVNQADRFYVGANSTDSGNNLNVLFDNPPTTTATGNMFMLF
jgi:hypothetical protein